jgi:lipoate-protein ligase A
MLYIEPESTDAAFHFSAEEYCMRNFEWDEPVFMIWRTDKCAMLGSNQIADAEIDLAMAERMGLQIVRRASGGGTIFTDLGTLLYTVRLPLPFEGSGDVTQLERDFVAGPVVRALNRMEVPARLEGRNDIVIDGRKISGLAQHARKNRLCTHGSLLYDADLETLVQVLRADEEKISSKALRSMRSRVTNISPYMKERLFIRQFWDELKKNLREEWNFAEYELSAGDKAQIEEIKSEKYASSEWTFGRAPRFSFHNQKRFPMGKVEVFLDVKGGVIDSCKISGDFLGLTPIRGLEERLEAKLYQRRSLEESLADVELEPYIGGITLRELLLCLFA